MNKPLYIDGHNVGNVMRCGRIVSTACASQQINMQINIELPKSTPEQLAQSIMDALNKPPSSPAMMMNRLGD